MIVDFLTKSVPKIKNKGFTKSLGLNEYKIGIKHNNSSNHWFLFNLTVFLSDNISAINRICFWFYEHRNIFPQFVLS